MDWGSQMHRTGENFSSAHRSHPSTTSTIPGISLGSSVSPHLAVQYTLNLETYPTADKETKFLLALWVEESEGYTVHQTKNGYFDLTTFRKPRCFS